MIRIYIAPQNKKYSIAPRSLVKYESGGRIQAHGYAASRTSMSLCDFSGDRNDLDYCDGACK